MFIMLDGIDGSGKSTVIEAWKNYLSGQGNTIFDLKEYWKKETGYPNFAELKQYDFIFSCEPTYADMGLVIRNELIKTGTHYPARTVAQAYALDRLILYTKVIIPAVKNGQCVIQDRGVSTSLCYQPLMDKTITMNVVHNLVGNKLALAHRPDYLVLLQIDPKVALKRLSARNEKQDNVIFERLTFQKKIARVFASKTYRQIFVRRGTHVVDLLAEDKIDIMKEKAINLLKALLIRHS